MHLPPQLGPRRGFILATILAVAAGGGIMAAETEAPPVPAPAATPGPSTSATNGNVATGSAKAPEVDLSELTGFLRMSNEQLEKLRKGIENLEKMSPAEREALRQEVQTRMQNARQLNEEIREDLRTLSPAESSVIRRYEMAIFSEEIQALIKRFKDAPTPEARQKIIAEMQKAAADKGIKADPNNPNFGGQPSNGPRGGNGNRGGRGNGPGNDGGRGGPRSGPPPPNPPAEHHN